MATKINPYVGPRPFEEGEGHLFFGRERDARDLSSLIVAHSEVLVYAQSGAGKTSLLNAKVIPALREKGFELLTAARLRAAISTIPASSASNIYISNVLLAWAEDSASTEQLSQLSLTEFLAGQPHRLDDDGLPCPRGLIFDQFEEFFTSYPDRWKERAAFFEQVSLALRADSLLRVVFVIREDFLAEFDSYSELLPGRTRARIRLERLREQSALAAVTEPLKGTERTFSHGVAEQLVEQLRSLSVRAPNGDMITVAGEFVEPAQLQAVCQRLWQEIPADARIITREHLQEFGNIREVLIEFYDRSLRRACDLGRTTEYQLRRWFERSLITAENTRGTVVRGRTHTGGIHNGVVDILEEEHILRGEWRGNAHWYELSHDRFIEAIQISNQTRRLRIYRRSFLLAACLFMSSLIIFSLDLYKWRAAATVESSWGLPRGLARYGAQLTHLSVVCMVDDLQWLPRNLVSLNANCERITSLKGTPPNLHRLDVSGTSIENLHDLPPGVVDLNISSTLVSRVDELSGIEFLDASGIRILDMRLIPRSVRKLKLQHPEIESLEGLPEGLIELEVNGTSINSLKGIPASVRRLTLSGNSSLVMDYLPPRLERLETDSFSGSATVPLSLNSLAVRNAFLYGVPSVRELELVRTPVVGDLPEKLESLKLHDGFSRISLGRLPPNLQSLKIRWPKGARFTLLPKSLKELDLSGSEDLDSIAGLGAAGLDSLADLNISLTSITDLRDVPPSVVNLRFEFCEVDQIAWFPSHLSTLHLGGCSRLNSIGSLPATLSELYLQGVPVSSVNNMPRNLKKLDLSNTNILRVLPVLPETIEELTLHVGQIESLEEIPRSLSKLFFVYRTNGVVDHR